MAISLLHVKQYTGWIEGIHRQVTRGSSPESSIEYAFCAAYGTATSREDQSIAYWYFNLQLLRALQVYQENIRVATSPDTIPGAIFSVVCS